MGEKKVNRNIQISFEKLKEYEVNDTRFVKVEIKILHTGLNYNGSIFTKEVVEENLDTLANTPILAFIEENSEGDIDFSDHRMVLERTEDGDFKLKYLGEAIGVIPESHNARWEIHEDTNGEEREYLVCEGLIWTKWDDPIDILNREGKVWQSMELSEKYSGHWNDDGHFVFDDFEFNGACLLSNVDTLPAMDNSTAELVFTKSSTDKMFSEIKDKLNLFYQAYPTNKGGKKPLDEKLKLLEKYSISQEELESKGIDLESFSLEKLEDKLKELTDDNQDFSYTASQLKDLIRAELYKDYTEDEYGYQYNNYWYVDHTDEIVVAEDTNDGYLLVGIPYSIVEDKVIIDFDKKKRVKLVYEFIEDDTQVEFEIASKDKVEYQLNVKEKEVEKTVTEKVEKVESEYEQLNEKFSILKEETEELRQFKESKLAQERAEAEQEIFDSFSAELTEDEMSEVKEKASEMSLEEIENQLYVLVGKKKATFSKRKADEKQVVKLKVEKEETEDLPYGGIFEKYRNK